MPTYLKYKYIFFYFELRSDPELDPDPIFFSAKPDPREKKIRILIPDMNCDTVTVRMNTVCTSNQVWMQLFTREFGPHLLSTLKSDQLPQTDWRKEFKACYCIGKRHSLSNIYILGVGGG